VPDAALPLPWESLLTLLGGEFRGGRLTLLTGVALRSRNRLYRLTLEGAPVGSVIVKVVRQEDDRFWEHHLRREHWLLELLERFWPGGAPRPFAAAFGQGWGLIVMEDVGAASLAERLEEGPASGDRPRTPLRDVLSQVAELHGVLRAEHRIFHRVCRSVELDSITAASLLARVRVARGRLQDDRAGLAAEPALSPSILKGYTEGVVRPLVSGRRQMIHNSLSPLNVVLGRASPRFVDWETMAYAAPEFDLADLLCYPGVNRPWPDLDRMVAVAFGPTIDPARLRLAALARTLDYAGSNAQQAARSDKAGDTAHALLASARRDWYLGQGRMLAEELGLKALVDIIMR
jgi:hypothetical protein